ncbi:4-oxalocrotonate decarboxylase [Corynebacterium sp. YIM 101645]|uniref:4-oxalocrotonate decarboxylase n=1 Tax=Corynebacterium lemuris TaxID=1859292 RepID=A0ABT2FTU0_9CORY|nr:fumarylacetoacetate hydrolase family protein [Corynebacterium lemuris]MCS5478636.1 4-oxalocrotonate decarboxylase [Corynebacterium lemuris]
MTRDLASIAAELDNARATATSVAQLATDLTLDNAYAIQARNLRSRVAAGERYIGPKLGFTSKSKMEQMGVSDVIVGFLTAEMEHRADQPLELEGLIHPRIEPELVFRLGQTVEVRADDTSESLSRRIRESVDAVAVGMEVIDSRYRDFKFSLSDVVADNTSAAQFIVGQWQDFPRELRGLPVEFLINGETVESSTTDAILGDPFVAFDQLATMTLRYGFELPAGAPILAGAMTAAHWLESGQRVKVRVERFPALSVAVA